MVIKWLKKLLNYLENKNKVVDKGKTPEDIEFIEKQRRIKRDFQKMMNYNESQARGRRVE